MQIGLHEAAFGPFFGAGGVAAEAVCLGRLRQAFYLCLGLEL